MSLDRIFRRLAPTLKAQRGEPLGHPSRKLGILNARLLRTGSSPARFLGRRRGRLALVFTPGASPGNRQTKFTCQRAGSRGFRIGEILTLGGPQDLSVESAAGAGALSPRHECRGTSRFLVAAIALLTALSLLLERSRLVATILIAFCAGVTATDALAQNVVAHVDGVFYEGAQPFVLGWACQPGSRDSLDVKISADAPNGPFLLTRRADFDSDVGVGNACRDREGKHRFKLPLPSSMFVKGRERKVYAEPLPPKGAPPALAGTYRHALTHPLVFTTPAELGELAKRSSSPGTYSATRFSQLAEQIARDLRARNDWSAVYTGCDAGLLQYAFSYEPQDGQVAQALRAALKLGPTAAAPAGAAVVASRLALYAALAKAGVTLPAGAPSPDQAAALAKKILLAWGTKGFRDQRGHFLTKQNQLCDMNGNHTDVAGEAWPFRGASCIRFMPKIC
jgi:hypothetical protein